MPINALNSGGTTSQKGLLHDWSSLLSYACKHKINHVSGKVKCWDNLFSVVFSSDNFVFDAGGAQCAPSQGL